MTLIMKIDLSQSPIRGRVFLRIPFGGKNHQPRQVTKPYSRASVSESIFEGENIYFRRPKQRFQPT